MRDTSPTMPRFQVGMLVFPDMTSLDFDAPVDALSRMPDTQVHVLSKTLEPVRNDIGLMVTPTLRMRDAPRLDLLFVGGGRGVNRLMEDEETIAFLRDRGPQAQWITAVCAGSLLLGAAGLLRGYRAATHWAAMEVLPLLGAIPTYERVVVDRNRITGGGVTAGLDFGLTVAAQLHGEEHAMQTQLMVEYDPRPPFDAGSPTRAPAHIVARVRAALAASTQERFAIARRIARV
jgi:cyclohexyl-isocyanide hydratase